MALETHQGSSASSRYVCLPSIFSTATTNLSSQRSGANVVHDPVDARIILVEPTSDEGEYFVDEWQDNLRVVLDYEWAFACVEGGRLLLQNDIAEKDEGGHLVPYGGFAGLIGAKSKDKGDISTMMLGEDATSGSKGSKTPAKGKGKQTSTSNKDEGMCTF